MNNSNVSTVDSKPTEPRCQPKTLYRNPVTPEFKNINVIFEQSIQISITIPIKEEHKLTCAWLRQEIADRVNEELQMRPGKQPLCSELTLQAMPQNLLLDYWLSLPNKTVSVLEDDQTLYAKPVQASKQSQVKSTNVSLQNFDILSKIGWGGFSTVYLVRMKENGKFYAMKQIRKGWMKNPKLEKKLIYTERNNCIRLRKPFIVNLHYAFQSEECFYFVMDYAPGLSIRQVLYERGVFSEEEAKFYIAEVIEGLEVIHLSGILYRDLKSENLLIDENGHIKFCDFGIAKKVDSLYDLNYTICGTPETFSSEMVFGKGYNVLTDYYSIGILAYELIVGNPPFRRDGGDLKQLAEKIAYEQPKLPSDISEEFKDFILRLLCKNPEQRLGAQEGLNEIRKHKWLGDIDFERIHAQKLSAPVDPADYIFKQELAAFKDSIESSKGTGEKHPHLLFFDYNCEDTKSVPNVNILASKGTQKGASVLNLESNANTNTEKRRSSSSDRKNVNVDLNLLLKPQKVEVQKEISLSLNGSDNFITLDNHAGKLESGQSISGSLNDQISNQEGDLEWNSANSLDERSIPKMTVSKTKASDLSDKKSKVWIS